MREPTGQGGTRRRGWATTLLMLVLSVGLTEGLLRGAFMLRVRLGSPLNCGIRPELLGRLVNVYSRPRRSPEFAENNGLVPDTRRGYRLAAGLHDHDLNGTPLSTNSRGLRGGREYALPKPPAIIRIVAVGDSFTFGEGVTDEA